VQEKLDVTFTATSALTSEAVLPESYGLVSQTWVVWSGVAGSIALQVDIGGGVGWQTFATEAHSAGTATVIVTDIPGKVRAQFTPATQPGRVRIVAGASGPR
jgi:hypothetical protein